ncbi:MAG TPA: alpha/beta hydrolase [Dokdonella sp.]|uniref:alpha/beta fold hydrolase n=1 Tax=Dokdonella sp. TaxID=2291710 RepID=UPI002B6F9CA9|nr:alpha/beta hydrolase [Dokdonella sp.]HUD43617.1 alpha/beta hydrolase [Dokdonella sp.]
MVRSLPLPFALLLSAGLLGAPPGTGEAHAAAPNRPAPDYAEPGRRVDIGGRSLNLRCSGEGAPTVVLEAGFGADAMAWWRVQPMIAARQRVCAYDRAGYGFSDPGPMPRGVDAEVADLHALIEAAGIATPVILVGHSFGSNIVRRYDQRHGGEVAALVLVEPPPQHIGEFSPAYQKQEMDAMPQALEMLKRCERGAQDGALARPTGDLRACLRPPDPRFGQRINDALRANQSKPAFWQTLVSGSEAKAALFAEPVDPAERHGDKPLLVLTARHAYAAAPLNGRRALEAAQLKTHETLAQTSSRGRRVTVNRASHDVPEDRPDAIADAVAAVIEQLGAATR